MANGSEEGRASLALQGKQSIGGEEDGGFPEPGARGPDSWGDYFLLWLTKYGQGGKRHRSRPAAGVCVFQMLSRL